VTRSPFDNGERHVTAFRPISEAARSWSNDSIAAIRTGVATGVRAAGRTGRHLLGAANGRKLFLKIHVKIQIVISHVFACNKNKALQLQRVPILSILRYNTDLYFKQALQFPNLR